VWLDEADAYTQQLALVNSAGNVIIKVDNFSNVTLNQKRNSVSREQELQVALQLTFVQVRITTKSTYDLGSLWIIDAVHLPYGCSVSPLIFLQRRGAKKKRRFGQVSGRQVPPCASFHTNSDPD